MIGEKPEDSRGGLADRLRRLALPDEEERLLPADALDLGRARANGARRRRRAARATSAETWMQFASQVFSSRAARFTGSPQTS